MSWKYRIGILYIGFVIMILGLVGLAYTGKVELVDKNYYQKEVQYQKVLDARKRGLVYQNHFRIEQTSQELRIVYPPHLASVPAKVEGYCYSDASKDFKGRLQERIDKALLRKGNYKITVQWGNSPLDTLVELHVLVE